MNTTRRDKKNPDVLHWSVDCSDLEQWAMIRLLVMMRDNADTEQFEAHTRDIQRRMERDRIKNERR